MCILFFEARNSPASDEYALILVNNRDEDYSRPTKVSHFWAEDSRHDIIGGRDAFPGKEGGTWIGMSKAGKIGILLNLLQPVGEEHRDAMGRGHLVSDYLCSDVDSATYLDAVSKRGTEYNHFHLMAIEIKPPFEKVVLGSYNNRETLPPTYLKQGIHGMGNSPSHTPWCKVVYGRDKFTEVVARHRKVDSKERLIEELLGLLADETRHLPDPQLEKQGKGKPQSIVDGASALHVKVPEENYGTRTNTVILVDGRGQVEYIERTMEEPINAYNPKWIVTRHKFTLTANK